MAGWLASSAFCRCASKNCHPLFGAVGGYKMDPNIPEGMEFIPSSVPDGNYMFNIASTSPKQSFEISVSSPCMTFEDYYA